jgi:hypothetical protein
MIAAEFPEDRIREVDESGELELIGYLMTVATADALNDLRLSALVLQNATERRALLLSRDALRVDTRLQLHLEGIGVKVSVARTSDYGALMENPQQSQPPTDTIELMIRWLSSHARPQPAGSPAGFWSCDSGANSLELEAFGCGLIETPWRLQLSGRGH